MWYLLGVAYIAGNVWAIDFWNWSYRIKVASKIRSRTKKNYWKLSSMLRFQYFCSTLACTTPEGRRQHVSTQKPWSSCMERVPKQTHLKEFIWRVSTQRSQQVKYTQRIPPKMPRRWQVMKRRPKRSLVWAESFLEDTCGQDWQISKQFWDSKIYHDSDSHSDEKKISKTQQKILRQALRSWGRISYAGFISFIYWHITPRQ